jgi:(p)ppGpp synthase/HD superfamily hydrolase
MGEKLESAESFAKDKHRNQKYETKPYYTHLESVVDTLKNIGVNDDDVLCAAWLHDAIEDTDTTFDDIEQRFGSKVAVMVLSISKDSRLPKKEKERQYVEQLKNAPLQAQLIKLCDISSNLKELKNSSWSKTKKSKYVKKKLYNLNVIKSGLAKNKTDYPRIQGIIDGVNKILVSHSQRPIII